MSQNNAQKRVVFSIYNVSSSRLPVLGARLDPLRGREKTSSKPISSISGKGLVRPCEDLTEDQVDLLVKMAKRRMIRIALRYGSHVNDVKYVAWNDIKQWWRQASSPGGGGSPAPPVEARVPQPPPINKPRVPGAQVQPPVQAPSRPVPPSPPVPLAPEKVEEPSKDEASTEPEGEVDAPKEEVPGTGETPKAEGLGEVVETDSGQESDEESPQGETSAVLEAEPVAEPGGDVEEVLEAEPSDDLVSDEEDDAEAEADVPEDIKVAEGADITVIDWESLGDLDGVSRTTLREWGRLLDPHITGVKKTDLAAKLLRAKELLGL